MPVLLSNPEDRFCRVGAICCEILLRDVRRNIEAFTENWSYDTDFLVIILITAKTQTEIIRHKLTPFQIFRAIQLCGCDKALIVI